MSDYTPTTEEVRDRYAYNEWDIDEADEGYPRRAEFDRWFQSEIEKAERRSRVEFADELTRKGVYSFDIHSIRRYADE